MSILERKFKYNSFLNNLSFVAYIICITVISIFILISTGSAGKSAFPLLLPMSIYFIYSNFVVLKIFNDHCEFKLTSINKTKSIQYNELSKITIDKKYIILHKRSGYPIKLLSLNFHKDERDEVVRLLQSKI